MSLLSTIADITGIIGTLVSLGTLLLAFSFKKKLIHRSDQRSFRNNINRILDEFQARIYSLKDEKMFTKYLIEDIETLVNDIYNNYYTILTVSKSSLNNLRRGIDSYYSVVKTSNADLIEEQRRDCLKKVEKLCADLRRDNDSI